jgi:hypothetical protein
MITFGNRCAECGAVGISENRLAIRRYPMTAYHYERHGGLTTLERVGEATLARQLCQLCASVRGHSAGPG